MIGSFYSHKLLGLRCAIYLFFPVCQVYIVVTKAWR